MSPLFEPRTTLKDALSMMLDADVQAGIVVDDAGAVRRPGDRRQIAERMRERAGDAPVPGGLDEVGRCRAAGH